jgi:hypothetical protein
LGTNPNIYFNGDGDGINAENSGSKGFDEHNKSTLSRTDGFAMLAFLEMTLSTRFPQFRAGMGQ